MTENVTGVVPGEVTGQMFLYEKPELLTPEVHGDLGFTPAERPYDFAKSARAIPLTMVEFGSAQRNYPIIFTNRENPVPLAVVALFDDTSLFVDREGQWDSMCYVPVYLRCHPFACASETDDRMAMVVDRAADSVTENPKYPFFVDGKASEHVDTMMRLVADFERERRRTEEFCEKLVELDVLTALRAMHTPEGATEPQPIADYIAIDAKKVDDLPQETVFELHKKGFLSAIYLHLYSLENWRNLMARKVAADQAASQSS